MSFWESLGWMLWATVFVGYLFALFAIVADLFRDHKLSGWLKAVWIFFLLFLPILTALVYLVARLKFGGFELLDTQFLTGHLARFGAIEVRRAEFQRLLEAALYCPKVGNVEGGGAGLGRGGR